MAEFGHRTDAGTAEHRARAHPLRTLALWLGPLLAAAAWLLLAWGGHDLDVRWCAAIGVLCATWWIGEPIPIAVTALVPLALLPLTGVMTARAVAPSYGHDLVLLLMGGFLLSVAMEKSGAHERIALGVVRAIGRRGPRWLVLGFMVATALVSMWMSNTAATLMLLPVALATARLAGCDARGSFALLLGLAYAANIGGMGTPIGSPPNLVFMSTWEEEVTTGTGREPWTFLGWMAIGVPVIAVLLPIAWVYLTRGMARGEPIELPRPAAWTRAERRVLLIFGLVALAWVTLKQPFGGWSGALASSGIAAGAAPSNTTVAILGVLAMFLVPDGRGGRLLDWSTAARIPWGIVLLFGGGIALAAGFRESGLAELVASQLVGITVLPTLVVAVLVALAVSFLTEVTSNTAITVLLMPILAATAIEAKIDPALLMLPAAFSASCAFMLPVATPPNAIVVGSGCVEPSDMARAGFVMNVIGAVIVAVVCWLAFA